MRRGEPWLPPRVPTSFEIELVVLRLLRHAVAERAVLPAEALLPELLLLRLALLGGVHRRRLRLLLELRELLQHAVDERVAAVGIRAVELDERFPAVRRREVRV